MRSHDNNLQSTKNFERIQKQKRQKKIKIILLLPRPHPHPVADIVPPRGDQGLLQHLSKWQWAQGPPLSPWAPHPPTCSTQEPSASQPDPLASPGGLKTIPGCRHPPTSFHTPLSLAAEGCRIGSPPCHPGELPWLYGMQAGLCGIAAPPASEQNFLRSKGQDPARNDRGLPAASQAASVFPTVSAFPPRNPASLCPAPGPIACRSGRGGASCQARHRI